MRMLICVSRRLVFLMDLKFSMSICSIGMVLLLCCKDTKFVGLDLEVNQEKLQNHQSVDEAGKEVVVGNVWRKPEQDDGSQDAEADTE